MYSLSSSRFGKRKAATQSYQKILINYASPKFASRQKKNATTGLRWGKFDQAICYGPQDIDAEFRKKNHHILSENGERGWCLWKPYIILKTLKRIKEGDYLFYSDSGSFFINSIDRLIRVAEKMKHDVVVPTSEGTVLTEAKRDSLILMDMDDPVYLEENVRPSTYVLLRKSFKSVKFTEEWLELSQDRRLITDDDNVMGKPNHDGFRFHRTQTILTLLYIKYRFANDCYVAIDQTPPNYGKLPSLGFDPDYLMILTITARLHRVRSLAKPIELLLLNVPLMNLIIYFSLLIDRIDKRQKTNRQAYINRDKKIRLRISRMYHLFLGSYRIGMKVLEYGRKLTNRERSGAT